jgi:murein DD-endopeptidase MepM/ murein hydrolase activator NlpD
VVRVSYILGERLFPERQLLLKSSNGVRHVALPGWLQATTLAACVLSLGAGAYLAMNVARHHDAPVQQIVAAQTTVPVKPPAENAGLDELRSELTQLRGDLAAANQNYAQIGARYQDTQAKLAALAAENDKLRGDLKSATAHAKSLRDARDEAEHRAKTAEQALNSKTDNLSQLAKNLDDNKTELRQSEAERTTLQNRLQQLQMELQAAKSSAGQQASQNDAKHAPQQQIAKQPAHAAPSQAEASPATESAQSKVVAPVPERKPDVGPPHAQAHTSELERLLASTGLDVDRLLSGLDARSGGGQGGPYIALNGPRAAELEKNRQEALRKLAKMLPLRAPLNDYEVDSPFGPRIDPINHHASFHPGVDLGAPYKTPVYSTAAGTVIFTGAREGYGRTVEISHGHGIVTLYAHLHRILVARGQKVGAHVEVGELGSTGRSTGPHLHYEVDVDGTPLDPSKFMEVGKNVVQISGK